MSCGQPFSPTACECNTPKLRGIAERRSGRGPLHVRWARSERCHPGQHLSPQLEDPNARRANGRTSPSEWQGRAGGQLPPSALCSREVVRPRGDRISKRCATKTTHQTSHPGNQAQMHGAVRGYRAAGERSIRAATPSAIVISQIRSDRVTLRVC